MGLRHRLFGTHCSVCGKQLRNVGPHKKGGNHSRDCRPLKSACRLRTCDTAVSMSADADQKAGLKTRPTPER
jgi:hypothetical protein